jgi:hypothetical protein
MTRQHRPYMAARVSQDLGIPPRALPPDDFEAPPRRKTGRPSGYTPELGHLICKRLVEGETVRKLCLDEDMPPRQTIYDWLTRYPDFRANYTIAMELNADSWADLAQQIADDPAGDYIEKDGKLIPNWENVQRSRLRVDTIKWRCRTISPRKYSDRIQMSGADEKPIQLAQNGTSDADRVRALKLLLEKARGTPEEE